MRNLPIGITTFEEIRKDYHFYVDKTKDAYELIKKYKYVFLSRPRRFGKSLFVDTLKCIFEGKKELFEGLYIYDKWNWEEKYPVFKISFSGNLESKERVESTIVKNLNFNKIKLQLEDSQYKDYSDQFEDYIYKAFYKYNQKVVILIDEYDKPILDNILDIKKAKEIRNVLSSFYSVIKELDEYIRFVFITGVSKFSKTGIFSGLNQLVDITIDERYGNICGYRQEDVEELLKEYNSNVDLEEVKKWYNGYYWLKDKLYNPFDILLFVSKNFDFQNYWFLSGTPTFLKEILEQKFYFLPNFSNLVVNQNVVDSSEIEDIDIEGLFFQSGYLTIEEKIIEKGALPRYRLRIPNYEVQLSLFDHISKYLSRHCSNDQNTISQGLKEVFKTAKLDKLESVLSTTYSKIPYNNLTHIANYEGYYASVLYIYLLAIGMEIIGEDVTNKGRIDLTIKHMNKVYIMEFKVGEDDPLQQIKERKYYEKYMNEGKEIYIIGINFDSEQRNISKVVWERIG